MFTKFKSMITCTGVTHTKNMITNSTSLTELDSAEYTDVGRKQVGVAKRSRDAPLSHEFSLVLDVDFESFVTTVDKRIGVSRGIARALGDLLPTNVRVTRLERGSVAFFWTNSSLMPSTHHSSCPVQVRNSFQSVFEVRTNMLKLNSNYGQKDELCHICGKRETKSHIFECEGSTRLTTKFYKKMIGTERPQKGDMDSVRQSAEAIRMNMEQRTKIKMIINKYG